MSDYKQEIIRLVELLGKGDYLTLTNELKALIANDRHVFTDPFVKSWCGRRWRNLFISEAIRYPGAVKKATKTSLFKKDKRSDRQKIAEFFLRNSESADWQRDMPGAQIGKIQNVTLVFSPGLLNGLTPVRAFQEAFPAIKEKYGWKIIRSDNHPMRGCNANTEDLLAAIRLGKGLTAKAEIIKDENAQPPGDVFILGYSKGTPDVMAFLVKHPELASRIRCIFNWAGAPGGSYLANGIYEKVKDLNIPRMEQSMFDLLKQISPVIKTGGALRRSLEFDVKTATHDLTTTVRGEFNGQNNEKLDQHNIPVFNITGSTRVLEVPIFQIQGKLKLDKYDVNNDMQVTQEQAKVRIPMATDLAMLRGHHWDLSLGPFPKIIPFSRYNLTNPFPKEAAVVAMFKFAAELGLID